VSVGIGNFKIETQDNTNSYITIGLGIVAVVLSLFGNITILNKNSIFVM